MGSQPGLNTRRTKAEKTQWGFTPSFWHYIILISKENYLVSEFQASVIVNATAAATKRASYTREQRRKKYRGIFPTVFHHEKTVLIQLELEGFPCISLCSYSEAYLCVLGYVQSRVGKQREKTLANSWLVRQYFEFWSCSPVRLLLFIFRIPKITAHAFHPSSIAAFSGRQRVEHTFSFLTQN